MVYSLKGVRVCTIILLWVDILGIYYKCNISLHVLRYKLNDAAGMFCVSCGSPKVKNLINQSDYLTYQLTCYKCLE